MSTRAIRTSTPQTACDVCGRTLLRGEHAEVYVSGLSRRSVCELCKSRALHGGWVREGTLPEYDDSGSRSDRRRSLLGRLRNRRDAESDAESIDGFNGEPRPEQSPPAWPDPSSRQAERRASSPRRARRADRDAAAAREPIGGRQPRHVRAVPTSIEHRISSAVSLFNASEHPRRVAGIARSLGVPDVSVHPSDPVASMVNVVVSWELCWYRYEVDLSDEVPSVRAAGQGYELSELSELERQINFTADDRGQLDLGA